ncbi:MAG: amidinotransferase [Bacteroidetes bacterium]|nr:MAG: amidinotransferase [Bacteroidota bacterium]REK07583.1 MAG: amidinotransferase [Bacteroidota bacterium]REK36984.1 MAG: amidinotransferase [Bacteroidota bacterium]REK47805.1 MAG: amidinotransferase [Bacteroidota bacterium]
MSYAKEVLMVDPAGFRFNPETGQDNYFMSAKAGSDISVYAREEFDRLKYLLEENGMRVSLFKIEDNLDTPDAVFPNNWFSTHPDGRLVIYPMKAPSRRLERRSHIIDFLKSRYSVVHDFSRNEDRGLYLEGTGSIVMDHDARIAWAALSERTSTNLLYEWGKKLNYSLILFSSDDEQRRSIYHTNVMMCLGPGFAILCTDSIRDSDEKRLVKKSITESGRTIIEISMEQMKNFCGNCLALENDKKEKLLIMSSRAHSAFSSEQIIILERHCRIIHTELSTFETLGGGGARCMIAELF